MSPCRRIVLASHARGKFNVSNTWIGSHAFIDAGVVVGANLIVTAGAVVLGDVPPNSVAGGILAKVLRHRTNSGETIATLLPTSKRNVP